MTQYSWFEMIDCCIAGMHKKSIEASEKLGDSADGSVVSPGGAAADHTNNLDSMEESCVDRRSPSDIKNESIASLRAKALQHSVKMLQAATSNTKLISKLQTVQTFGASSATEASETPTQTLVNLKEEKESAAL